MGTVLLWYRIKGRLVLLKSCEWTKTITKLPFRSFSISDDCLKISTKSLRVYHRYSAIDIQPSIARNKTTRNIKSNISRSLHHRFDGQLLSDTPICWSDTPETLRSKCVSGDGRNVRSTFEKPVIKGKNEVFSPAQTCLLVICKFLRCISLLQIRRQSWRGRAKRDRPVAPAPTL